MSIKLQWLFASSIIIWITRECAASSTRSFVVSFQNSGGWSTEEWVEINKPIPLLKEFTACHWEKLQYFSGKAAAFSGADFTKTLQLFRGPFPEKLQYFSGEAAAFFGADFRESCSFFRGPFPGKLQYYLWKSCSFSRG